MNSIYLNKFGKLTINRKNENGVEFCEIPNKFFSIPEVKKSIVSREEYVKSEFSNSDIRESMNIRGVEYIYHFTSVKNLFWILKRGFLPRCYFKDITMTNNFRQDFINASFFESELNDPRRLDNLIYSTSFSISMINHFLLSVYKERYKSRNYCIIKVDKKLITKMFGKEYFFYHNAASKDFEHNKSNYKKGQYFNMMFYNELHTENHGVYKRDGLDAKYTTSPQAEVMINGILSKECIVQVIFKNIGDLNDALNNHYGDQLKEKLKEIFIVDPSYFDQVK